MNTLLIGYDLNEAGQDYKTLIDEIKELSGGTWWHHLDSTWLIRCELTAKQVRDHLKQFIDKNDELLVINVTADNWAGVGFEKYDWLHKHLA